MTDLKPKHFDDFALSILEDDKETISVDTFDNYMAGVRKVLVSAVSEGVIEVAPNSLINKQLKIGLIRKHLGGT